MVKPTNIRAIEAESGLDWPTWCAAIEERGGSTLSHNAIVKAARQIRPISGWWAQSVAVAYEQHINRRLPGQTSDGLFAVSLSRSVTGSPETAMAQWRDFMDGRDPIGEKALSEPPTDTVTPKWRYWRCKFTDGSRLTLTMQATSTEKVRIAIEHRKLPLHGDIAGMKAVWSALLADCFA